MVQPWHFLRYFSYFSKKFSYSEFTNIQVRYDNCLRLYDDYQEDPPLVVRQHADPPKRYVVLTSHSVQIFIKLRPVDLLKQILKDSRGQDTTALKAFFTIQKEAQACATALILASLESEENIDVAELATRAFFMFGGEPQIAQMNQTNICKCVLLS